MSDILAKSTTKYDTESVPITAQNEQQFWRK